MPKDLNSILEHIRQRKSKKLAVLLDPDELADPDKISEVIQMSNEAKIDYFFVGGSLIVKENFEECLNRIKILTSIPVILFPGSPQQISKNADAILLLSLISGRNADMLIGQHVLAAPTLKASGLEILPTGYMLINCGLPTTASYMSNTNPIPWNKDDIAMATAMAGEQLGLKLIYLDGGSGADKPVSQSMISRVRSVVNIPIIVGGGIRSGEDAAKAVNSGADVIVVGNAFEKNPKLIFDISRVVH